MLALFDRLIALLQHDPQTSPWKSLNTSNSLRVARNSRTWFTTNRYGSSAQVYFLYDNRVGFRCPGNHLHKSNHFHLFIDRRGHVYFHCYANDPGSADGSTRPCSIEQRIGSLPDCPHIALAPPPPTSLRIHDFYNFQDPPLHRDGLTNGSLVDRDHGSVVAASVSEHNSVSGPEMRRDEPGAPRDDGDCGGDGHDGGDDANLCIDSDDDQDVRFVLADDSDSEDSVARLLNDARAALSPLQNSEALASGRRYCDVPVDPSFAPDLLQALPADIIREHLEPFCLLAAGLLRTFPVYHSQPYRGRDKLLQWFHSVRTGSPGLHSFCPLDEAIPLAAWDRINQLVLADPSAFNTYRQLQHRFRLLWVEYAELIFGRLDEFWRHNVGVVALSTLDFKSAAQRAGIPCTLNIRTPFISEYLTPESLYTIDSDGVVMFKHHVAVINAPMGSGKTTSIRALLRAKYKRPAPVSSTTGPRQTSVPELFGHDLLEPIDRKCPCHYATCFARHFLGSHFRPQIPLLQR